MKLLHHMQASGSPTYIYISLLNSYKAIYIYMYMHIGHITMFDNRAKQIALFKPSMNLRTCNYPTKEGYISSH